MDRLRIDLGRVRAPMWYTGDAITGDPTEPASFDTGISPTYEEDLYINTDIYSRSVGNIYKCVHGGNGAQAKWIFAGALPISKSTLVVDRLDSTARDQPLSANQGRALFEMLRRGYIFPKYIYPTTSRVCESITLEIDDVSTDITVTDTNGNSHSYSYAGKGKDIGTVNFTMTEIGFAGPVTVYSVACSASTIHRCMLYDTLHNRMVDIIPDIWENVIENDRDIEPGQSINGKHLAQISKRVDGSRVPLYTGAGNVVLEDGSTLADHKEASSEQIDLMLSSLKGD